MIESIIVGRKTYLLNKRHLIDRELKNLELVYDKDGEYIFTQKLLLSPNGYGLTNMDEDRFYDVRKKYSIDKHKSGKVLIGVIGAAIYLFPIACVESTITEIDLEIYYQMRKLNKTLIERLEQLEPTTKKEGIVNENY